MGTVLSTTAALKWSICGVAPPALDEVPLGTELSHSIVANG